MTTKGKTKQRDTLITSFRLPVDQLEEFRKYAASRQRSVSGELRYLIEKSLQKDAA